MAPSLFPPPQYMCWHAPRMGQVVLHQTTTRHLKLSICLLLARKGCLLRFVNCHSKPFRSTFFKVERFVFSRVYQSSQLWGSGFIRFCSLEATLEAMMISSTIQSRKLAFVELWCAYEGFLQKCGDLSSLTPCELLETFKATQFKVVCAIRFVSVSHHQHECHYHHHQFRSHQHCCQHP